MKLGKSPVEENPVKRGKSPVEENPNSFCRICACSFRIYLGNTQISMKDIFVASKQKEFVGQGTCTGKNVFASLLTVALALKRFYCRNFVNDLKQFRSSRGLKPFLSIV